MEVLQPINDLKLNRYSSINQNRGFLAVHRGGEWVPICFDVFDGVDCHEVKNHKAVLALGDYLGYQFPVGERRYLSDVYVASDQKGTETRALPSFYGAGFYEEAYDRKVLVNSADGALGVHNDTTLRIGQDYILATDEVEPIA